MDKLIEIKLKLYEKYKFDEDILTTLLEYCHNKSITKREDVMELAKSWSKNNIRTKKDLQRYFKKCKKIKNLKGKILSIIGRELTEYESTYIKSWIYNYNISEDDIILIFKKSKIINFNEINMKLLGIEF